MTEPRRTGPHTGTGRNGGPPDAPDEQMLAKAERELRKLPDGSQRAVGGGVYMRIDAADRRRFTYRGLAGMPGGTAGSWQTARDARRSLEERAAQLGPDADPDQLTRLELRQWTLAQYAQKVYWPEASLRLELLTRVDYKRKLVHDLLPVAGQYTLEEIEQKPLIVDGIRQKLRQRKTFAKGEKRAGEFAAAAADGALKLASILCDHMLERELISRNPFKGVPRFNRRRSPGGTGGGTTRRVKASEIVHPRVVAQAGLGIRCAHPVRLLERRVVPFAIANGLRPQDVCGMRHFWWRDESGPLQRILTDEAVKDVEGYLFTGEPKTGSRELYLFDFFAELLERIYQAQGCPGLDALVFPNTDGGLQDWGNWTTNVWYPALHRAGIARRDEKKVNPKNPYPADSPGAFDPYLLRHVGISTMLHARRHDGTTANYSDLEVARQFANSAPTIHRVYADIPPDLHGIAGLTMDEIYRRAWHETWGPAPGDPDYVEVLYDTAQASAITGISVASLGGRISRGSLPAHRDGYRYYLSEHDLVWAGLIPAPTKGERRLLT